MGIDKQKTRPALRCAGLRRLADGQAVVVPRAGIEPARPKSRDFKSLVSTNFTTGAGKETAILSQSRAAGKRAPSAELMGSAVFPPDAQVQRMARMNARHSLPPMFGV